MRLKLLCCTLRGLPAPVCRFAITFLLLVVSSYGFRATAQQVVSGTVLDSAGKPVSGVSIKETSRNGTVSNDKGYFSLTLKKTDAILEISHIGYQTQRMRYTGQKELVITLKPAPTNLNDVVIIGVQRQSQRTSIASVSGIVAKDIENKPVASVDELLQGRVAGVDVQISSGAPGVAPTVVVRGNSTINTNIGNNLAVAQTQALSGPLYVIDGIPVDPTDFQNTSDATGTNFLAGISINDIQNVQVQRDAVATAAWGSRGANGVIYITTKKGVARVPVFEVNSYIGVQQRPQLLPTLTGTAERNMKMKLLSEYATSPAQMEAIPQILSDSLNPSYNNATDWQGMFYHNALIKNVDGSMSAGSDAFNYRLSLNYYDQDGIIKGTGYQRYSMRGNFGFKISPKLNSQVIVGMTKEAREAGEQYDNSQENTPFDGASQPTSFYRVNGIDSANYANLSSSLRNSNQDEDFSVASTTNYDIVHGLRFTVQAAANEYLQAKDYFQPSNVASIAQTLGATPDLGQFSSTQASNASSVKNIYSTYVVTNSLNYDKVFNTARGNTHSLNVTAMQQYTVNISNTTSSGGTNAASDFVQTVSNIPQQYVMGSSDYLKDAMLSFMGQAQYNYNGRYLLYGSIRQDASSRFGINNKWGTFPSVGAGWIVSDEKFMSGISNVVNFLKLKFTYGLAGQLPIGGFYAPFNSYSVQGTYNGSLTEQPSYQNGLTKSNLTWGKTYQKDLGLELNLFKNRIMLQADIYEKVNKSQQFTLPLPFFTGYSNIFFNATDLWINNRGLDLTLNTNNLSPSSPIGWHSTFVLSFNKNIIAKLPNGNRSFTTGDYTGVDRIFQVGMPIYEFYQVKYQGVVNNVNQIPFNKATGQYLTYFHGSHTVQVGDPLWLDPTNTGDVWSGEGNVPTGNPNPLFTGGFTNDITYKNFTLTISTVFTWKRTVYNNFIMSQFAYGMFYNGLNGFASARIPDLSKLNYWTPEKAQNPNYKANFPSLNPWGGYYYQFFPFTSEFNADGSYLKVKFITLNYNLPSKISDRLRVQRISVYTNISNLLTIRAKNTFSMPDPEAVDQTGQYSGGLYPQAKAYTLGLDVRF